MPRLIWVFTGRTVTLLVLSCRGSFLVSGVALYEETNFFQTHMRSYPVGLDVLFLVRPFVYFRISCVRTAKALASLRGCAGLPEPSLVAYLISTKISWAGSNDVIPSEKSSFLCFIKEINLIFMSSLWYIDRVRELLRELNCYVFLYYELHWDQRWSLSTVKIFLNSPAIPHTHTLPTGSLCYLPF